MKQGIIAATALVAGLALAPLAHGATWTGWITDANCAGAENAKAEHKACAERCHKNGAALVFYNPADEKVYQLDKQDLAAKHAGDQVKLTGTAEGDKITIESIAKADGGDANHAGH
jgi:hypothetical protein